MARNGLAGTKSGNSKSALYYQSNPEAKAKKQSYDAANNKKPSYAKKRGELAKLNAKNPNSKVGDGLDVSHKPDGSTRLESQKQRGGKGMPGDKRARGGKKMYQSKINKK